MAVACIAEDGGGHGWLSERSRPEIFWRVVAGRRSRSAVHGIAGVRGRVRPWRFDGEGPAEWFVLSRRSLAGRTSGVIVLE
jgi:hypothetical protein